MKLEPVYLISPPPPPPSMPTRRAFLLIGASMALGATGGFASARWLPSPPEATKPPVDERLVWLQQQCDDATPITSLLRNRIDLLQYLPRHPDDARLWHGVDRVVAAIVGDRNLADRPLLAQQMIAALSAMPRSAHFDVDLALSQLREAVKGR